MPILNVKIGKHEGTQILFGSGDIRLVRSMNKNKNIKHVSLFITEGKPIEIGSTEKIDPNSIDNINTDKLPSIPVSMRFTKIESIDVLIEELTLLKEQLSELCS